MKKIKFLIALATAKITARLLKLRRKSGVTSFPGYLALKVDKDFMELTQNFCKKKIITITGTNGKTTTSGFIADILKEDKNRVLHNEKGANMPQGIATTLALGLNFFRKSDYFVLENDEAYLSEIYDDIKADYLVLTNLFRDQLDRYGELATTAKKIKKAILKNPDLKLVVNADDPMLADLIGKNSLLYGFEEITFAHETTQSHAPREAVYCKCGKPLEYKKNFYSHIGHYYCDCGFKRLVPQISAKAKVDFDKTELEVNFNNEIFNFTVEIPGLYNAYNALGAIAMALELDIDPNTIQNGIKKHKAVFGRAEKIEIRGKKTLIQLIKNPVGASEVIRTISGNKNAKLLIIINDNYADGRDVSWLWDADFDALKDNQQEIITSGIRAYDMALRLKYTGFDPRKIKIIPDIKKAIEKSVANTNANETLNILPTYTALLKMQNILKNL